MTETELAWAAGFFDGEGCIVVNRIKSKQGRSTINDYLYLYVCVAGTCEQSIRRLHGMFNLGTVRKKPNKSLGPTHSPSWTWSVRTRQAVTILELLRPYLYTKCLEADLALEFGEYSRAGIGVKGGTPKEVLEIRSRIRQELQDCKSRNVTMKKHLASLR